MKKGAVWLVDIPKSEDSHEQHGSRPVCIISEGEANIKVIIPFTSNLNALKFKNVIKIKPDKNNNLKETSVALVFQVRSIDKRRLKHKIGFLEKETLQKVSSMLIDYLK